jgi:hypothetical protein
MRARTRFSIVGGVAITTLAMTATTALADGRRDDNSSADHRRATIVEPGTGTISQAVAAANPGDTLQLKRGTYYDSVAITKTLTLRGVGDGTVIMPPPTSNNPCNGPGQVEGLCAAGAFDAQGNPDLTKPVKDVRISKLRTTGFSDTGVIGFNTTGLRVSSVRSDHNGGYGIARFVSTNSRFSDNWTSYNGEAGLYVGDSPNAASFVVHNRADHNGDGIFLRDSTGVTATDNTSWGNCIGILALNTGQGATGPSGAGKFDIEDNRVFANDKACPASEDGPPTSGIGIALAGVDGTVVRNNDVDKNAPSGPSLASGGVVIISTKSLGGSDPTNNLVKHNDLHGNQPADIVWDGTGTGNTITNNDCRTSIPANTGWCSSNH